MFVGWWRPWRFCVDPRGLTGEGVSDKSSQLCIKSILKIEIYTPWQWVRWDKFVSRVPIRKIDLNHIFPYRTPEDPITSSASPPPIFRGTKVFRPKYLGAWENFKNKGWGLNLVGSYNNTPTIFDEVVNYRNWVISLIKSNFPYFYPLDLWKYYNSTKIRGT